VNAQQREVPEKLSAAFRREYRNILRSSFFFVEFIVFFFPEEPRKGLKHPMRQFCVSFSAFGKLSQRAIQERVRVA
jgi:hypothetical protein